MPVVKVKVQVGRALLGATAKPFGSTVTVKHAIDTVLKAYQDLSLQRVDIYPTDAQLAADRTSLDLDDLLDLELAHVQPFGLFFVACCSYGDATATTPVTTPAAVAATAAGGPTPLPSAFNKIMAAAPLVVPARWTSGRFDFDILLEELCSLGLGWQDMADAEGAGKQLLIALMKALQYALPI